MARRDRRRAVTPARGTWSPGCCRPDKPANTRDLAAQTIGLCLIDPERRNLSAQIQANVERLLALQRPNGHWSVKFDPNYPITEMQTGESLYALHLAGQGADDPAMRKGILALLTRQQPFGGWFDINPYEQFRTPFRETQWALMALATIYPGRKQQIDRAGMIPSARNRPAFVPTIQRPSSATWSGSGTSRLPNCSGRSPPSSIIPSRWSAYAACRTLGRVGSDAPAIDGLVRCLGDESKVVQRAAAEGSAIDRQPAERLVGIRARPSPSSSSSIACAPRCVLPTTGRAAVPRGSSPPTSASSPRNPGWPTSCSSGSTTPIRSSRCRRSRDSGDGGTGG